MYEGKKIAVAGFGEEGKSSLEYFKRHGATVTVLDEDEQAQTPDGVEARLGSSALQDLSDFDMVLRTPPLRPDKLAGANVTSQTKLFFDKCPAPVVGVTGTKGKGTTATLIKKILEESGKKVWLVGNIGAPALDVLDDVSANDIVVFELSSFQLWDLDVSPHIAVVLMISEDHLDVHHDMDEYLEAKSQIANHQTADDFVIYHPTNVLSAEVVAGSKAKKIKYLSDESANVNDGNIVLNGKIVCKIDEVGLIGPHNLENVCAAITAASLLGATLGAAAKSVKQFKGLPHRLQVVGESQGVRFIDDSFSTTEDATIAAIKSFEEPKVLILGGSDKGVEYRKLAEVVASSNTKKAVLIGDTATKIANGLKRAGFDEFEIIKDTDMSSVVRICMKYAAAGDVVILSPGCASFGLFDNYKQRGEMFEAAVKAL